MYPKCSRVSFLQDLHLVRVALSSNHLPSTGVLSSRNSISLSPSHRKPFKSVLTFHHRKYNPPPLNHLPAPRDMPTPEEITATERAKKLASEVGFDLSKLPYIMDMSAKSITKNVHAINNATCEDERMKFVMGKLVSWSFSQFGSKWVGRSRGSKEVK